MKSGLGIWLMILKVQLLSVLNSANFNFTIHNEVTEIDMNDLR
jgi:hypothetical protein